MRSLHGLHGKFSTGNLSTFNLNPKLVNVGTVSGRFASQRLNSELRIGASAVAEKAAEISSGVQSNGASSTVSEGNSHLSKFDLPSPQAGRLIHDNRAFVEEQRIRAYEADPDQRTNIVTIANLLQVCPHAKCASLHGSLVIILLP